MHKNLTLRLEEAVIRRARVVAVLEDKSLSQWVSELIIRKVGSSPDPAARKKALRHMERGLHLGGVYPTRDQLHER